MSEAFIFYSAAGWAVLQLVVLVGVLPPLLILSTIKLAHTIHNLKGKSK